MKEKDILIVKNEEKIATSKTIKPKHKKDKTFTYAILSIAFLPLSIIFYILFLVAVFASIFALKNLYSIWFILWVASCFVSLFFNILCFCNYAKLKERNKLHKTSFILSVITSIHLLPYLVIVITHCASLIL